MNNNQIFNLVSSCIFVSIQLLALSHEQGVGCGVWGVGNPILKSRSFKKERRVSRTYVETQHIFFIFPIPESRGLYPFFGAKFFPTPYTLHPAPKGLGQREKYRGGATSKADSTDS